MQVLARLASRLTPRLSYRSQLDVMFFPYWGGLVVLVFSPLLIMIALSFTQYDFFSSPQWIGLTNYQNFFIDRLFQRALFNSVWFGLMAVPLRVTGALLLALALNKTGRAIEVGRAVVYLPTVLPEVAYALIWVLILNPGYGPLNFLLRAVGLPPHAWLDEPFTARASIVVMWVFQLGEGFILLLAALQTLSPDVLEAALLDGANRRQVFRRITLPLIAPALLLLSARDAVLSLQGTFTPALMATRTGPYYATYFLPHYIFDESFALFRYGYGAAATVVLCVVTGGFILIYYGLFKAAGRAHEI